MDVTARRSRVVLIALCVAVALVVGVAVIAVFTRGGSAARPAGSPEGIVQRYAQAVAAGDTDTAIGYLVPEIAADCFRTQITTEDLRLTLLQTSEDGDSARVRVLLVEKFGEGPFGSQDVQTEETFELVRAGGDWRIRTAPWQLTVCDPNAVVK